jgi:hypothetical protein
MASVGKHPRVRMHRLGWRDRQGAEVSTSSSSHRWKSSCIAACPNRRPNGAALSGLRYGRDIPESGLRFRWGTVRGTIDFLVAGGTCPTADDFPPGAMADLPSTQPTSPSLFEVQSNCIPSHLARRGGTRRGVWRSGTNSCGSLARAVSAAHRTHASLQRSVARQ